MFVATVAFAVALAPASALAAAKGPAYVGTWGDAASCKLPQSDPGAPMVIKRNGYDRNEAHCKFSGLKKKGNTWSGRESCKVEGSTQRNKITLKVDGDTLTIDEGPGPRTLPRCQ
jgi:hypothetical protein